MTPDAPSVWKAHRNPKCGRFSPSDDDLANAIAQFPVEARRLGDGHSAVGSGGGHTIMRKLFGTDGMRGVAGEYPLDPSTCFALGVALARWIGTRHLDPSVVIGMDTRES